MNKGLASIFSDFIAIETPTKSSKIESVKKLFYPTVHPDDYYPVSVIEPNMDNGPWIAGGAVMRWFQNDTVELSDIDVFCASEAQFEMLRHRMQVDYKDICNLRFTTDNALTYDVFAYDGGVQKSWTIQLIKKHYFDSADAVLDKFDITACQFITDGFSTQHGPTAVQDLNQKKLRFRQVKPDSLKRYIKYMAYGFRPDPGLFDQIVNQSDAQWQYSTAETAYDGF